MNSQVDEFRELREVWRRIVLGRWWVLALTAISAAGFGGIALVIPPKYVASAVLAPVSSRLRPEAGQGGLGGLSGIASLVGVNIGGAGAATEEALAVLRSRQFTEQFIADRGLLPVLFPDKWDQAAKGWKSPLEDKHPTLGQGYKKFEKDIRSIDRDVKSGLVTVSVTWTDRVMAADWVNDLVARLNKEMRSRDLLQSQERIGFLTEELAKTEEIGVRDSINKLIESEIKQRMLANVNQEYVFRVVDQAVPADPKDVAWPRKSLFLLIGAVIGFVLGTFIALIRYSR